MKSPLWKHVCLPCKICKQTKEKNGESIIEKGNSTKHWKAKDTGDKDWNDMKWHKRRLWWLVDKWRADEEEGVAVSVRRQFLPKFRSPLFFPLLHPALCWPVCCPDNTLNCWTAPSVEWKQGEVCVCVCGGTNTEIVGSCVCVLVCSCNCFIYCIWVCLSRVRYLSIQSELQ